jgi:membrane protein required for colicin V production
VTLFDYLVLFVLAASIIVSLLRGVVKELLSLLSWVAAFVVANAYSAALARMLPAVIPGEAVRLIVAFVALFIGARILMGLLSMAIDAVVTASGLGLVNRGLGGLFGLGRGIVIVLAGMILAGMTSIPQQAFWREARLRPLAESAARTVKPYLPAALAQHVHY